MCHTNDVHIYLPFTTHKTFIIEQSHRCCGCCCCDQLKLIINCVCSTFRCILNAQPRSVIHKPISAVFLQTRYGNIALAFAFFHLYLSSFGMRLKQFGIMIISIIIRLCVSCSMCFTALASMWSYHRTIITHWLLVTYLFIVIIDGYNSDFVWWIFKCDEIWDAPMRWAWQDARMKL